MPIGVIMNTLSIVVGGIIGAVLGNRISDSFIDKINMIFGCCSMCIGISSIALMENMPAVIFSVIIGTAIGLAIHLGDKINAAGGAMQRVVSKFVKADHSKLPREEFDAALLTVIVLFCASGTGIYGSLVAGISGDHSVLLAKSILDLFTALIFACSLGAVVCVIAAPQFIIFLILFMLGGVIIPHTTPAMVNDFKACGGVLVLATGFRIIRVKMFPVADMLPAMVLVMPINLFWINVVTPAVAALAG